MDSSPRPSRIAVACVLVAASLSGVVHAQKTRILIPQAYAQELRDLERRYPDLELVEASSKNEIVNKVTSCDAVVGIRSSLASALVPGIGNLRWIQGTRAGVETYLAVPEIADSSIVITDAKIVGGPPVADHAMALLLNLTRDLRGFADKMDKGWDRESRLPLVELRGKTMLIVGLGGVGTQLAERSAAFGMRVLATDRRDVPYLNSVEYVGKPDELDALIPQADVIVNCSRRTVDPPILFGPDQFALMKDEVYIINVSRGGVIDTGALVAALKSGKVRAAGLDVVDPEPLPPNHELWHMPNVIITPRVASRSEEVRARRFELFRDNIGRFINGLPLRNVVDRSLGF